MCSFYTVSVIQNREKYKERIHRLQRSFSTPRGVF
jgi:hypothetical protein